MITAELIYNMQSEIQNSIRNLNSGGCIHFAYYFSKALNLANVSHKVVFTNYDQIDLRYDYFSSVAHVLIYIPGIGYIDGYETFPTKESYFNFWRRERYRRHVVVSEKKLNNFRTNYRWNTYYSKRQNKKLERIIQKHINGTGRRIHKKG